MKWIKPREANLVLTAPEGMEDRVDDLPVVVTKDEAGNTFIVTLWEPNEVERLGILSGLPIMISTMGTTIPPMAVSVAPEVDSIYPPKRGS